MSNKHEVERLLRGLHRITAGLSAEASEAEWRALHVQIKKALSLARGLEAEDVRRKWQEAAQALSVELARLDLGELEATSIEDYCINDGSYMVMLRYDDVLSLRKTLEGLVIKDVEYTETFKRSILLQAGVLAEDLQRELYLWSANLRGLYDDESIAKMTQLDTTLFRVDFWFQPPRGPKALGQTDEEFIQGLFFDDPDTNLPGTFTIIEEK